MTKLIGLYSPVMQSGKSEVAKTLMEKGYIVLKFASPIKLMLKTLYEYMGISDIYGRLEGNLRLDTVPGLPCHARHMMQTLGTEWGRKTITDNIWVDICIEKANQFESPIVIDDLRFPNEYEAIKNAGGHCVKIVRPGIKLNASHPSEGGLEHYNFDCVIKNDSSLKDLKLLVGSLEIFKL